MTQAELAEEMGTKPTAISRFESPNYGKLSISTLKKIAQVLNCDLQIRLRPENVQSQRVTNKHRTLNRCGGEFTTPFVQCHDIFLKSEH